MNASQSISSVWRGALRPLAPAVSALAGAGSAPHRVLLGGAARGAGGGKSKLKECAMKINDLKKRLQKDRPMTTISLCMPQDVVDDLKRVAPRLGFSGYQPLIRANVGQGLRKDLERLEANPTCPL